MQNNPFINAITNSIIKSINEYYSINADAQKISLNNLIIRIIKNLNYDKNSLHYNETITSFQYCHVPYDWNKMKLIPIYSSDLTKEYNKNQKIKFIDKLISTNFRKWLEIKALEEINNDKIIYIEEGKTFKDSKIEEEPFIQSFIAEFFNLYFYFYPLTIEKESKKAFFPIKISISIYENFSSYEELKNTIINHIEKNSIQEYLPKIIPFDYNKELMINTPNVPEFHAGILSSYALRKRHIEFDVKQEEHEHIISGTLSTRNKSQTIVKFKSTVFKKDSNASHFIIIEHPEQKSNSDANFITEYNPKKESITDVLSPRINQTFGAKGLKVLTGILVALADSGYTGKFTFEMNTFLKLLGYKKDPSGSYNKKIKEDVFAILSLLAAAVLIIIKDDNKKTINLTIEKIISLNRIDITIDKPKNGFIDINKIITKNPYQHKYTIEAGPIWYNPGFKQNNQIQYSKMLKTLACEDVDKHGITLILTHYLTAQWRMSRKEIPNKISYLLKLCKIDLSNNNFRREIMHLEKELNYMKSCNYLGDWMVKNTGDKKLNYNKDTLNQIITLSPPKWFSESVIDVITKNNSQQLAQSTHKSEEKEIITGEHIKEIIKQSNYSGNQFSKIIELSASYISQVVNGKKTPSKKLKENIKNSFPELWKKIIY